MPVNDPQVIPVASLPATSSVGGPLYQKTSGSNLAFWGTLEFPAQSV